MCGQTPTHSDIVDLENYIDAIDDSHRIKRQAAVELLQSQQALFSEDLEGIQNDLDGYVKAIERMRQDLDNLSRQVQELRELRDRDVDYILQQQNAQHRTIMEILGKIDAPAGMYRQLQGKQS